MVEPIDGSNRRIRYQNKSSSKVPKSKTSAPSQSEFHGQEEAAAIPTVRTLRYGKNELTVRRLRLCDWVICSWEQSLHLKV